MNPSPITPEAQVFTPQSPPTDYSSTAAATAAAALSQNHVSPPTTNAAIGRKRKASGLPGSRGVANLTPEQLAKKRANDREAQRAIRERTKNTIEGLEQRIKELESQQPFQELQRVALERDRALAECEQLRNKLAVVQSVVGGSQAPAPQQQQPNLHELAALTAQQTPLPPLNTPQTPTHFPPTAQHSPYEQQHLHPELRTRPSPVSHTVTAGPTYPVEPAANTHYPSANGVSYEPRLPPPAAMLDQSNGERLGLNYVLSSPKHHSVSSTSPVPAAQYAGSPAREKPLYARLPVHSPPTCPLDSLLLDFLANRRKQIADGIPKGEVLGPYYPTFDGLHDPRAARITPAHPISALLTEILFKFPGIANLPEKVAVHYVMFLHIRWMICPCEECYERLPYWMQPIKEQLEIPHAAWSDQLPWPSMRRRIATTDRPKFEDLFIPFTGKLGVNWQYPADQVLLPSTNPDDASAFQMNPVFESHLRDIRNWSVGTVFKTTFPEMVDDSVRVGD